MQISFPKLIFLDVLIFNYMKALTTDKDGQILVFILQ